MLNAFESLNFEKKEQDVAFNDIVESLKKAYAINSKNLRELEAEVTKRRGALTKLAKALEELGFAVDDFKPFLLNNYEPTFHKRETFSRKVLNCLKNSKYPLATSQMADIINSNYPDKKYAYDKFSKHWAVAFKRKPDVFRRLEFPNHSPRYKYFYCLNEWFDNDKLKEPYKSNFEDVLSLIS